MMIKVATEYSYGAIDLLDEHEADYLMEKVIFERKTSSCAAWLIRDEVIGGHPYFQCGCRE